MWEIVTVPRSLWITTKEVQGLDEKRIKSTMSGISLHPRRAPGVRILNTARLRTSL